MVAMPWFRWWLCGASLLATAGTLVEAAGFLLPVFDVTSSSPLFEVWTGTEKKAPPGGEPEAEAFPLQRTEVNAAVSNGVAHVRVTQKYHNTGTECLHSRYIFPLPSRGAISAMSMVIGQRTVVGEIRTRSDAKKEFEEAKDNGQTASLLDQERPNVFAMELANIVPGDTVEVVVEYEETLAPIDGIFAFTFPTVVGPRYGQGWAPGLNTSNLLTDVLLNMSPPCLGVQSVQEMSVSNTPETTQVAMNGMNTDIVAKFWFTEAAVGAQLLVSTAGSEKYFSLAIQPPQRRLLESEQISRREYLFILDVSGSMTGYPIELSKSLMLQLLRENVRDGDRMNIMLFAGGSAVYNEENSVVATPESVEDAAAWLDKNMLAGGGTELLPALKRAFGLPRSSLSAARTVVIMTDGYVTVEREAFDLVRDRLGEGSIFVFGIGSSVNHYLVEGLARAGYGEPFVVMNEADGSDVVEKLRLYIDSPVMTSLKLSFEGDFKPQEQEPPHLPDVYASRPVQVVGKWTGQLSGTVRLEGLLADGEAWQFTADLSSVETADVPAIRLLWARARIAVLSDYASAGESKEQEEARKEAVTQLGLQHSLMTEFTSFVAVDSSSTQPGLCAAPEEQATTTPSPSIVEHESMLARSAGNFALRSAGSATRGCGMKQLLLQVALSIFVAVLRAVG